ncbi:MAG: metallophosphoesterase [Lachnospiraceae bacterium]|nr:metallophosphoesterase [Lachnospiraceae bacterium]
MAFIITGDTHATLDIGKVVKFFEENEGKYSEDDHLIICGDVGVCGFDPDAEKETRRILRELPVTVLFVDGNHEHHQRLNDYPVDEWMGGRVHFIESKIIHLMRGQVYDIDGTSFFTFGGAYSVDRYARTEGIDWFPEEIPTKEEYEEGLDNLEKHDYRVDYIITHTAPREVAAAMGYGEESLDEAALRRYLQQIADEAEYKRWFFGHFHEDEVIEDVFVAMYDEVIVIDQESRQADDFENGGISEYDNRVSGRDKI